MSDDVICAGEWIKKVQGDKDGGAKPESARSTVRTELFLRGMPISKAAGKPDEYYVDEDIFKTLENYYWAIRASAEGGVHSFGCLDHKMLSNQLAVEAYKDACDHLRAENRILTQQAEGYNRIPRWLRSLLRI